MKNYNSIAVRNEVLEMQMNEVETVNQFINVKYPVKTKKQRISTELMAGLTLAFVLVSACVILNHFHLIRNY